MTRSPFGTVQLNRRGFIATSVAAGFTLAGCGRSTPTTATRDAAVADAIAVTEAARPHSGRTVTATLAPQQATIDLGGVSVQTLAYGNTIPGRLIRANVGDELALTVTNRLNRPTSVHWHGIALRNDMDGAEPATANIKAGQQFTYRFSVPHSGLTGRIRTSASTPTTGCICLSSSTTQPSPAAMTPNGSSCSTTGPTASARPPTAVRRPHQPAAIQHGQHARHGGNDDGRCRHERLARRRRRRYQLPVLSGQRSNPRSSQHL
ncbi:multicopper oxidase family protein [Mycobacterium xenopi 4042]|uniref:Multicopper oxidase family protein n=1 Tax=Mycobacterium xenopi 4042 TaxID=1299334 RepID=X8AAA4_MYCXE|nr:multicopper oxidase family protein [Mycobacterium xenopi 4042]